MSFIFVFSVFVIFIRFLFSSNESVYGFSFSWTLISQNTTLRIIMTLDQYMTELTFPFRLIQKLSCYKTKCWMLNEVKVCIIMDPSIDIRKLCPVGM